MEDKPVVDYSPKVYSCSRRFLWVPCIPIRSAFHVRAEGRVIGHLGSLRDTHPCRVTHHRNKTLFSPRYDCIPFAIHTRAHTRTHTHTHTHIYTLGTEFTLRDDMIYCVRSTEATQLRPRATVVSRTAAARQERKVRGEFSRVVAIQLSQSLFLREFREWRLPFSLFLTDRLVTQSTRASGSLFLIPSIVDTRQNKRVSSVREARTTT